VTFSVKSSSAARGASRPTTTTPFACGSSPDGDGSLTNVAAKIYTAKISGRVLGTEIEAVSTTSGDSGNSFRYDSSAGQYIFNLSKKALSHGTWQLRIDLLHDVQHVVSISLKK